MMKPSFGLYKYIYTFGLISICFLASNSHAEIYKCKNENGKIEYRESACDAGSVEGVLKQTNISSVSPDKINKTVDSKSLGQIGADQANQALKSSFSRDSIKPEIIILRTTLGQFVELDQQFDVLANNYYRDATYEMALKDSFYNAIEFYGVRLSDLNNWVNETQSAYAYAARGYYYSEAHVFDDVREKYNSNAYSDFQKALAKSPKLSPVYAEMLYLARSTELPMDINEIFEKAIDADPRSFYVRYQYMLSFAPSFNYKYGSAELISKFALQAQAYAAENPRLYTLLGDIHADKAVSANNKNDCHSVVLHYMKAFEYGERVGWLESRADCLYRLGKKKEAKSDYERILYYEPTHAKAGEWTRWIKKELKG